MNVRLVPTLVARTNDDVEPFDLYAGHVSNANAIQRGFIKATYIRSFQNVAGRASFGQLL